MNKSKERRMEAMGRGSPLANHSMNQQRIKRTIDGEDQYFRKKSKKALRAETRRRKERDEAIVSATKDVDIAPKGIIFSEDLG